jgi:hypothetical protein
MYPITLKQPNQPGMHLDIREDNTFLKVDDPDFINELTNQNKNFEFFFSFKILF